MGRMPRCRRVRSVSRLRAWKGTAADPISYSAGFVLATGLLHVSGICLGLLNNRPNGVVATRSVGAGIAALGVWFFGQAIGT